MTNFAKAPECQYKCQGYVQDFCCGEFCERLASGTPKTDAITGAYNQGALAQLCREQERALGELRIAAKAVCWFDWSDNDADAVRAINQLRSVLGVRSVQINGGESARARAPEYAHPEGRQNKSGERVADSATPPPLSFCGRCDEDTPTDADGRCPGCTKLKP